MGIDAGAVIVVVIVAGLRLLVVVVIVAVVVARLAFVGVRLEVRVGAIWHRRDARSIGQRDGDSALRALADGAFHQPLVAVADHEQHVGIDDALHFRRPQRGGVRRGRALVDEFRRCAGPLHQGGGQRMHRLDGDGNARRIGGLNRGVAAKARAAASRTAPKRDIEAPPAICYNISSSGGRTGNPASAGAAGGDPRAPAPRFRAHRTGHTCSAAIVGYVARTFAHVGEEKCQVLPPAFTSRANSRPSACRRMASIPSSGISGNAAAMRRPNASMSGLSSGARRRSSRPDAAAALLAMTAAARPRRGRRAPGALQQHRVLGVERLAEQREDAGAARVRAAIDERLHQHVATVGGMVFGQVLRGVSAIGLAGAHQLDEIAVRGEREVGRLEHDERAPFLLPAAPCRTGTGAVAGVAMPWREALY